MLKCNSSRDDGSYADDNDDQHLNELYKTNIKWATSIQLKMYANMYKCVCERVLKIDKKKNKCSKSVYCTELLINTLIC